MSQACTLESGSCCIFDSLSVYHEALDYLVTNLAGGESKRVMRLSHTIFSAFTVLCTRDLIALVTYLLHRREIRLDVI